MKWLTISIFLMAVPSIFTENIFRINITPEEAQQYLQQANLETIYAPKTGENPVPLTKNAEGEDVYQGRRLPNPGDFVEEHYLAKQYHGQDGLGRYLFGYSDWNQGRVEAKNGEGEIRGTYKYVDPNGRDFIANYWADSLGFHQEDNRPKVILEPVTDTPEVQKAREEHFRLWKELAEAASQNADASGESSYQYEEPQPQQERANEIVGSASGSESQYTPDDSGQWKPGPDDVTSEPKGFFYSFDYSVPLLRNIKEREELEQARARNARSTNESDVPKPAVEEEKVSKVTAGQDTQAPPRSKGDGKQRYLPTK